MSMLREATGHSGAPRVHEGGTTRLETFSERVTEGKYL